MLTRLAARHLRKPSGIVGRYFGRAMNRLNQGMNEAAVQRLDVQPQHRVLDIGFGGGISLTLLDQRIDAGQIHGVEVSDTMLARARRRFQKQVALKRLVLTHAGVDALPHADEYFDRVCTVNTIYFWPDTGRGLREIHRVLRPGGRLSLCYRPKDVMEKLSFTRHGFELFEIQDIETLLAHSGFHDVQHVLAHDGHLGYASAVATRGTPT